MTTLHTEGETVTSQHCDDTCASRRGYSTCDCGAATGPLEAELVALRRCCADLAERLRSADEAVVAYAREHTAAWAELPECTGDLAEAIRRPRWAEWAGTWLLVENGHVIADISEDGEPPRVLWTVEGAGQGTARDAATGRRIVEAVIAAEEGRCRL